MIGWAGWYCRDLVSATSYTLIGVANKMFTILLGVFFLDKHASSIGILALVMSIVASTQYAQSPLRNKKESDKLGIQGVWVVKQTHKSSMFCIIHTYNIHGINFKYFLIPPPIFFFLSF
jgi:hypothetical protein